MNDELRSIFVDKTITLLDFLEEFDVTEILDALYSDKNLRDDIKEWCRETFGPEED